MAFKITNLVRGSFRYDKTDSEDLRPNGYSYILGFGGFLLILEEWVVNHDRSGTGIGDVNWQSSFSRWNFAEAVAWWVLAILFWSRAAYLYRRHRKGQLLAILDAFAAISFFAISLPVSGGRNWWEPVPVFICKSLFAGLISAAIIWRWFFVIKTKCNAERGPIA